MCLSFLLNLAGVQLCDLETLPVGVCLPLWDSIVHCQEAPPSSWPQAAYDIIGESCDISSRSCDISSRSCDISSRSCDITSRSRDIGNSCVGHVTNSDPTLYAGRVDVAKSVNMNTYTLPLKMEVAAQSQTVLPWTCYL